MLRLSKQKRRLAERDRDKTDEEDIFATQRDDYLSRILALAGLEAQYDKMKINWIITTVISGVVFAIIFMLSIPELNGSRIYFWSSDWCRGIHILFKLGGKTHDKRRMTEQLPQVSRDNG